MNDSPRVRSPRRTLLLVAASALAGLFGAWLVRAWLAGPGAVPATETAAVYDRPRALPDFALVAHDGTRFGRAQLQGRYTFVFLGFTNCPDLCPTTLAELAAAQRLLADLPAGRQPAVVMISVDPARDTAAVLARYLAHFDARFIGVSGADAELAPLAAALGAAYQKGAATDGSYAVDHTAAVFLVDPDAKLAAVFPAPQVARAVADDYRRILAAGTRG